MTVLETLSDFPFLKGLLLAQYGLMLLMFFGVFGFSVCKHGWMVTIFLPFILIWRLLKLPSTRHRLRVKHEDEKLRELEKVRREKERSQNEKLQRVIAYGTYFPK